MAHRPNTTSTSPKKWSASARTLGTSGRPSCRCRSAWRCWTPMRQRREAGGGKGVQDGQPEDGRCHRVERFGGDSRRQRVQERGGGRRVAVQQPGKRGGFGGREHKLPLFSARTRAMLVRLTPWRQPACSARSPPAAAEGVASMRRLTWMVCVGVVAMTVVVPRAQDSGGRPRCQPDEWPTFRAGTRLATIDAVVVDDQGRQVTDLKPVRLRDRRARERHPSTTGDVRACRSCADGARAQRAPPRARSVPGAPPGVADARGRWRSGAIAGGTGPHVDDAPTRACSPSSSTTSACRSRAPPPSGAMLTRYVDTQIAAGRSRRHHPPAGGVETMQHSRVW